MAMVVKNNMSAVRTLNTLNTNQSNLTKSLAKVSSGMKINSAADDASGYAISERMRVQIRSLDQANQNTQNGSSMMKTAEGAVSSTVEILKTLKEKVINAANDTNTDSDRQTIQKELNQSIDQIDDNANVTFNGKYLVDGSKSTVGNATYTSMTNQNLSTDTTADTKLTDLKSRAGQDLNITTTDKVTVSYVQQGKTYSTTFQVGSEDTLQTIFNKAEDIDTTSRTFAASDNENVKRAQKANGEDTSVATDFEAAAVEKAIQQLRDELADGDSGTATTDLKTLVHAGATASGAFATEAGVTSSLRVYKDQASTPQGGIADVPNGPVGTNGETAAADKAKADGVVKTDYSVLDKTEQWELKDSGVYSTETGSTVTSSNAQLASVATSNGKGSAFKAVETALAARNSAATALGAYESSGTTGSVTKEIVNKGGAAGTFGKLLADNGIAWKGTENDALNAMKQAEDLYSASPALESIKTAYNAYKDALNTYNDAESKLTNAVDTYNDKVQQLDALVKQKALTDAKTAYSEATDKYLQDLEKLATESGKSVQYVNADGTTVNINTTDTEAIKKEKIATMVDDLRTQLANLESAESVSAVTSKVKIGRDGVNTKMPAADPSTTDVTKNLLEKGAVSTEAGISLDASLRQAAATVTAQRTLISGSEYNVADKLQEALAGIVKENSGPALTAGSAIGVNANGDMVNTASGDNGITFTSASAGVKGQIAGFTISVSDSEGNIKKSVNASLDAFEETIRAVDKSEDNAISLQVGAKANQAIKVGLTDMRSEALGLKGSDGEKLNISTREKANAAINVLDNALQKALDQQTTIGSIESRLEYTSSNLTTASENVQASESNIRDADMAKEMTNYTKNNVLLQAAQSMLAQANQNSSAVLSLLQ